MPKPTGTSHDGHSFEPLIAPSWDEDAGAYDTLAQLFLGEIGRDEREGDGGDAVRGTPGSGQSFNAMGGPVALAAPSPAAQTPATADREPVECLILGHLPVLGSAWVSQYARCIAEEEDVTVALVQVRAGYATVEIVLADDDQIPQPPQARATLEAAIDAAAAVAGHWILRVEEPDEPALAAHPRVSAVTLLTSADEMAVVAAYRTLKRLLDDADDANGIDGDAGEGRPEVRVSIMGAPEPAAGAVFTKLSEAARMFIHRPIERAPGVHRVSSVGASLVLFGGPVDHAAQRAIDAISGAQRPARPAAAEAPDPKRWIRLAPETVLESAPEADVPDEAPVEGPSAATAPLASHIAGLTPLEITCPYAPGVQLGVDGAGRLHVLARHEGSGQSGLEPLTIAASWAVTHRALLAAVTAGTGAAVSGAGAEPMSAHQPPVLHMFVDEPRDIRRLLDADIRVHLLAAVEVGGQTAWLCRDLN